MPLVPVASPSATAAQSQLPRSGAWSLGAWQIRYARGGPAELAATDGTMVVLAVTIRGRAALPWSADASPLTLHGQQWALVSAAPPVGPSQLLDPDTELLLIEWPAPEFRALLAEAPGAADGLTTRAQTTTPWAEPARPTSLAMQHVARELIERPPMPLWLRAKAQELLALALAATAAPPLTRFSEYDHEQLRFARDYLTAHVQAPPSLAGLARLAGLNECKLKRGFRELFGLPVFAYLAEYRLREARLLIEHGGLSLSEIAFEMGYSSLPHFSAAFRKRFGGAPSAFRARP